MAGTIAKSMRKKQTMAEKLGSTLLSAGLPIVGDIFNSIMQGAQNKKMRQFAEKMYGRQRQDALDDWRMQNQYNDPSEQMARLKMAGLNPNLVYGSGAVSGITSSSVRASSQGSYSPKAPQINPTAYLANFQDVRMKNVETDNAKKAGAIMEEDRLLRKAQTAKTLAEGQRQAVGVTRDQFDLAMAQTLKDINIDMAKANLENVQARTTATIDENERREAMQAPNLQIAAERILNMRIERSKDQKQIEYMKQQIENLKSSKKLLDYEAELNAKGISKKDPAWMRILDSILSGGKSFDEIIEGNPDFFRGFKK